MNPEGVTVTIHDRRTVLESIDGGTHTIPVGPVSLVEDVFERRDPPATADLTNALGVVHDHLEDILIEAPDVAGTPSIVFAGHHGRSLAQVEIGAVDVPEACRIERAAIDDVFRTIVAERPEARRHNPGLDDAHLGTIVATCCIVLAIMRRLALHDAGFDHSVLADAGPATDGDVS